MIAFFFTAG